MTAHAPAWRRWSLLATLFAIGIAYVGSFGFFLMRSEDFVAKQYNVAAREYALANDSTHASRLQFGNGASGPGHLGSGWHPPEPEGTWSSRRDAWLFIAKPASGRSARLAIQADVHLPHAHDRMTVALFGNGVHLKSWTADQGSPQLTGTVDIPADVLSMQPVAFRFRLDTPTSPWRERTGNDLRTLGIRLRMIDVELLPET
jgi:hypothetical protein